MTSNARGGGRILGSLGSADGKGIVRMEDRFDTDDRRRVVGTHRPSRLARWYGEVEGDLRLGGEYRARLFASGWEGTGRVEACEPPQRLLVRIKDADEPDENVIEATLTADGDQTIMVWEERGMPLDLLSAYGAGVQIHVEDLADHLAGRERRDDARRGGTSSTLPIGTWRPTSTNDTSGGSATCAGARECHPKPVFALLDRVQREVRSVDSLLLLRPLELRRAA